MYEIEHRYLLSGVLSENFLFEKAHCVVQSKNIYVNTKDIQERFSRRRYLKHPTKKKNEVVYRRTVKIGHGLERLEFKDECNRRLYRGMKKHPLTRILKKKRFRIKEPNLKVGHLVWEVDIFLDRDLCLAEVEIPSADFTNFKVPTWLQHFVLREVTEERKYEGASLAL